METVVTAVLPVMLEGAAFVWYFPGLTSKWLYENNKKNRMEMPPVALVDAVCVCVCLNKTT